MIYEYKNLKPQINSSAFIAESSDIIGDVKVGDNVSIWFGTVIRADGSSVIIGEGSNIQDNCVVHITPGEHNTIIGEYVTIGHGVIIHGAKIGKLTLIGMGSIVLDGVEIGENTIIGAGSLIPQGKKIPSGVLCYGSPVKIIRNLSQEEKDSLMTSANHYIELSEEYKQIHI